MSMLGSSSPSRRRSAPLLAACVAGAAVATLRRHIGADIGAFLPPAAARAVVQPAGQPAAGAGVGVVGEEASGAAAASPSATVGAGSLATAVAALAVAAAANRGERRGPAAISRSRLRATGLDEAPPEIMEEALEKKASAEAAVASGAAVVTPRSSGGTVSLNLAVQRMWTRADYLHVHAISGIIHTGIGLIYILDVLVADLATLSGTPTSTQLPFDIVLFSMLAGAANAVSGLQVTLMPRPFKDVWQLLGFGEDGNLKSAGFVNTAVFYFILSYQSLRVLPSYPEFLQPLDPAFAFASLLALVHAIFIINSWVGKGLSQGFALGISLPLLLNVPVSYHLLLGGQAWVENLSTVYPGWPDLFFSANYALAWAGSFVTLVLSLYERKVTDLNGRLLLTVFTGAITFAMIPLRGYLSVPEWFQGQWMVMLTLTPPS
mmetsp:Transcript_83951/g.271286  ORF Transcript_83951/g.271286 Transcript_83951/m.271286 type:complete len:434 (-) Transcript_83951:164-1465(-)